MSDRMLAQLAALKGAPASVLKDRWRELFDREPPPYAAAGRGRAWECRAGRRVRRVTLAGAIRE